MVTSPLPVVLSLTLLQSVSDVLRGVDAAESSTGRVPLRRPVKFSEVSLFCDESSGEECCREESDSDKDKAKAALPFIAEDEEEVLHDDEDDDAEDNNAELLFVILLLFALADLDVGSSLRCNVRFIN